jgi:hypothetical protein
MHREEMDGGLKIRGNSTHVWRGDGSGTENWVGGTSCTKRRLKGEVESSQGELDG